MADSGGIISEGRSFFNRRIIHLNFYRIHYLYFVFVILLTSVIFWGSNTSSYPVAYEDALMLCASAMTNTGLDPVNLGNLNAYQQSILFVLMALGDLSIISALTVHVRRYYFRKKMRSILSSSRAGRRIVEDIMEDGQGHMASNSDRGSPSGKKRSKSPSYHNPNAGLLPNRKNGKQDNDSTPKESGVNSGQNERSRNRGSGRTPHISHQGYGGFSAPWMTTLFRKFASWPLRYLHLDGSDADLPTYLFKVQLDKHVSGSVQKVP